jgi:cytochrome c oxidase subunit IV
MGSVLELGKVITTVWLHKYWDRVAVQFKLYLVPAIGILMLITSMGIFGFLSKAHLDQAVPAGDISSQVQIFDDKIKTERDNIEAARKALKQMDAQVDEKLSRTTDDRGAERAVQIRRNQSKERTTLQNEISSAQKKISALQEQRAPIASQARKVEAEVGPIKYIAALIYGDNPDANLLEKAVRWVIILIVLVFDPLALVLILAADQTFAWHREDKKKREGWSQVWQPVSENPWRDEEQDTKDFFARGKELANAIDANDGKFPEPAYEPDDGPLTDAQLDKIQELADQQIAEEQTKNATLTRELEAVKATAENLKKKFVSWIKDPLKKKS